jgi:uncharacterized protein (DUF488 family)
MLLYRQKILLALLELNGGKSKNLDFQKRLFLFCNRQQKPAFDFVPYKYGCFSFQSYSDKGVLARNAYISEDEQGITLLKQNGFPAMLNKDDYEILLAVQEEFGNYSAGALIKYVYVNFPYYATRSEISDKYLSRQEIDKVNAEINAETIQMFFTVGYEGISRDAYLNKLLRNNVKILCDVRKNAVSMKYGFSKKPLQELVEKFDIKYIHIPELGIDSDKRQSLNDADDYKKLFADYKKNTLPRQKAALQKLYEIYTENQRAALTCFEADKNMCHRGVIIDYFKENMGYTFDCKHL